MVCQQGKSQNNVPMNSKLLYFMVVFATIEAPCILSVTLAGSCFYPWADGRPLCLHEVWPLGSRVKIIPGQELGAEH